MYLLVGTSTAAAATATVIAADERHDGLQSVDGRRNGRQWLDGGEPEGVPRGHQCPTVGPTSAAATARDSGTD